MDREEGGSLVNSKRVSSGGFSELSNFRCISTLFALKWRLQEKANKTSYDQANEKESNRAKISETIYCLCAVIHG